MTDKKYNSYYPILFALFLISGFCGLLYQVVWLRMAFAAFGVITPVLSVVVSVFMFGLAIGSWAGGKYVEKFGAGTGLNAISFYAASEAMIGVGGIVVPVIFSLGRILLLQCGSLDSFKYLVFSALLLGASVLPWCIFMGTTFPFMAAFIKKFDRSETAAFSYLYLANVLGAALGVVAAAYFLIELVGMYRTLHIAAVCNFAIALASLALSRRYLRSASAGRTAPVTRPDPIAPIRSRVYISILFMTGFASMGMEVVWTRAFTPVLGTTVYSFASILVVYLTATWAGSWLYRAQRKTRHDIGMPHLMACLAVFSFLPVALGDPRLPVSLFAKAAAARLSIFPFCAVLGYLTPKLIDDFSGGNPEPMGTLYAVNIIGCILGPLFAAYVLLPTAGARFSLVILSVPFLAYYGYYFKPLWAKNRLYAASVSAVSALLLACSVLVFLSYEDSVFYRSAVVRRDYAATVISCGEGREKRLLVNGVGITDLTPVTKWMAHLPLAIRNERPESILVVCLGMGTTFRSAASWDIDTTAVELVPSVRDAFGFYFEDAGEILGKPNARIVVDDGRRFLMRTARKYDVITIDPPPPIQSSCSGLLYSEDFYRILKTRLKEDGILAQWFPIEGSITAFAAARAIAAEFPFMRIYPSIEGYGLHFFASERYFDMPDAKTFAARLSKKAANDLVEWNKGMSPEDLYGEILQKEIPLEAIVVPHFRFSITDNKPFNEYFYLRELLTRWAMRTGGIPEKLAMPPAQKSR